MGVISIYNKYIDRGYSYTRVVPDGGRGRQHDSGSKGLFKNFDLNSILGGILPEGIDSGEMCIRDSLLRSSIVSSFLRTLSLDVLTPHIITLPVKFQHSFFITKRVFPYVRNLIHF